VTYLLVAFLVVLVGPLFIATWRTSLMGLALQGVLLTAIFLQRGWPVTASGAVLLLDLLLLRSWFVPRYLHRILRRQSAPRRNDVIPANMLSWTLAGALVIGAFHFAGLVLPEGGVEATHLAAATAALLLGFLVLGTENTTFSQITGALRIENAIALFELGSAHLLPLPVQLGVTFILILTVLVFGGFLRAGQGSFSGGREP
jgi:hydrogenase-4 membrane subunit HyfE